MRNVTPRRPASPTISWWYWSSAGAVGREAEQVRSLSVRDHSVEFRCNITGAGKGTAAGRRRHILYGNLNRVQLMLHLSGSAAAALFSSLGLWWRGNTWRQLDIPILELGRWPGSLAARRPGDTR